MNRITFSPNRNAKWVSLGNVLRLAVAELLECPEVPTAVVLNEAVELASAYSTDDSGRFVNGVLATLADQIRHE